MTVEFNIRPHAITPEMNVVDIFVDGTMVGVMFPWGSNGIRLISAHIEKEQVEEDFGGVVIKEDGIEGMSPIPSLFVEFHHRRYQIIDGRIVKEEEEPADGSQ